MLFPEFGFDSTYRDKEIFLGHGIEKGLEVLRAPNSIVCGLGGSFVSLVFQALV